MLYYDAATKAWTKADAEDDLSSDLTSLDEFEVAVTSEGSAQYESDDLDDCWEDPCVSAESVVSNPASKGKNCC